MISKNTKTNLVNAINGCIIESESYIEYLENLFRNKRPSFILADQIRWLESTNLSLASKKNDIPVYLISHGSHTASVDEPSKLAANRLSDGMLVSSLTSKTVVQSPLAYLAAAE